MFNKLKQFKDLRTQAKTLQNKLSAESETGSAVNDQIKVTFNGNQEITKVEIDPSILTSENKSKIENGIVEASNKALKKIQKVMAEKMKEMGDFDLGAMFGKKE